MPAFDFDNNKAEGPYKCGNKIRALASSRHSICKFFVLSVPQHSLSLSLSLPLSLSDRSMASITGMSISAPSRSLSFQQSQAATKISSLKSVSLSGQRKSFPLRSLRISCAAKPETVEKVCEIVKKQLALPDDSAVTADSKFSALGADSLDTVEIVMGLEEAFGISVEEENAQTITTVQEAADMIEKLVETK
ncbi:hypothetical protein NE237_014452 [Protea cynaroides]|uniref:Acyl carrier protein n=1 Tax=Protea cynaroides TaxID=273540 RepID=A0A9Q0KC42_9MAGN|nr:hypothetical protein NE237_014452 [Protea cynaroides]